MKNILIISLSTLFLYYNATAQTILETKLAGKQNFFEIMEIVEAHYDSLRALGIDVLPGDRKYKHWKRWEWYTMQHLNTDGSIADIGKITAREVERLNKRERTDTAMRSTIATWNFIGPSTTTTGDIDAAFLGLGRVDRIAFHPTNPNVIYIGTPAGGMWKTTNDGLTWTPASDFLPSIGISGLVVHPDNPDSIYVLTGDGDSGYNNSAGVFLTPDGGQTWTHLSGISTTPFLGYQLRINPENPLILWAATTIGLFRSLDGGLSWENQVGGNIYDVVLNPDNPSKIVACSNVNVYYSSTNGDTWNPASFDNTPASGRRALAVSADEPDVVYLLAGPVTGAGTFNGFYRSINSGVSFELQTTTPNLFGRNGGDGNDQSGYDIALVASPTNADMVLTGGLVVFRSEDGGIGFESVTTFSEDDEISWYVHPDIHDLKYNPLNGYLYAATDGGLYKSTDNGDSWTDLSDGIETTMFYNMAGYPDDETYLIGGTQDNGVKHRKTDDSHFMHIDCCDGYDVAFDPNTHQTMYASLNLWMSRYTNNGTVKTDITPKSHWFMRVATHTDDSDIVFAGTTDRLYKSTDQGESWDTIFIEANDGIKMCPSDPDRMYIAGVAGGSVRFHRTDNLGQTFDRLDDNPGFPTGIFIRGIAVHPTNADKVWVSFLGYSDGNKVFYSDNAGASWVNWTFSLPNIPFQTLEVRSNGDLFAGSSIGVFYKPASYADWIPLSNGLPRTLVTEFAVNEAAGLIRASTFGRGIWEASLPNGTCESTLSWIISWNIEGYRYYEASNQISTNFKLVGGANTNIYLKAGNQIVLTPGFLAPANGSLFDASIGPCTEGGIPDED